ncbi:MAG: MBL fold metallo-hydrolase [Candidatus Krumholzibacteriales bacterium]
MIDKANWRFLRVVLSALFFVILGCSKVDLDKPGLVRLDEGVYALISGDASFEENLGANRGFVVGSEGVLAVDSGYTPEHALKLLREIRKVTGLPVRFLVNTHYHPVNTWGNSVFREDGAVIISSAETAREMENSFPRYMQYYRNSNPGRYRNLKNVELALPDSLMDGRKITLDLGGRKVILEHSGPAHTPGDCLVYVPESGVIFSGGLISNGYHPNLADPGADYENWSSVLDRLSETEIKYIVPGEGRVCLKDQIEVEKSYIENLTRACADSIRKGVPLRRLLTSLQPGEITPEAGGYRHQNIFPYNVRAVFLRKLPEIVRPGFKIQLPEGFSLGGGGGGEKVGRMHWFRNEQLYEEIEVQWQPTVREEVLSQDVYSRGHSFKTSSAERDMNIEGDRKIDLGGEMVTAVYGKWTDRLANVGSVGFWTLAMTVRDGKLYTVNCLVRTEKDDRVARARLRELEKVLSSFTLTGR